MVFYVDSNNKTRHPSTGTIHNILRKQTDCSKSDICKQPSNDSENQTNHSKNVVENAEVKC